MTHSPYEHAATRGREHGNHGHTEAYKGIIKALTESIIIGPFRVIYEADKFLCVHRYSKFRNAEIFDASITAVSYKDQKIITQESRREELDYDPSEGQDWNWGDYE